MNRIIVIFLLLFCQMSYSQDSIYDILSDYIDEYKYEAQKDSGNLWGISFDIPLMIVIPDSNIIILDRKEEGFKQYKNVFIGISDDIKAGGNSSKTWRNEDWGFYTYPLKENKKERLNLIFHEAFHRNQTRLKLDGNWTQCKHLNSSDARSLLKLEFNALLKALEEDDFNSHIIDALSFRFLRYIRYPNAYNEEQMMEMAEGIAQYTGFKLSGSTIDEVLIYLQSQQHYNPQTFAYNFGLAYCYLLDKSSIEWRKQLTKNDNFLFFTQNIFEISFPDDIESHVENVRINYNWEEISKEEIEISKKQKNQEEKYLNMFFVKPVVKINSNLCTGFVFNTSIVYPLKNGKVYNGITTEGVWGTLNSKDEMFIGDELLLSTPFVKNGNILEGDGWKITLKDQWTIVEDAENNFVLVEIK